LRRKGAGVLRRTGEPLRVLPGRHGERIRGRARGVRNEQGYDSLPAGSPPARDADSEDRESARRAERHEAGEADEKEAARDEEGLISPAADALGIRARCRMDEGTRLS